MEFKDSLVLVIGSIGYDVYIIGENNKIVFSPGGFAWHCASGVLAADGTAVILANITKSFNKELLTRFDTSRVSFKLNPACDQYENAYIFDFAKTNYTTGVSYSEGAPSQKFSQLLDDNNGRKLIVHVGTTNPAIILERIRDIKSVCIQEPVFSSNTYFPYLTEDNYNYTFEIINLSSIVFVNYEELQVLKKLNLIESLIPKLVVVTCGKDGVALFENNMMISASSVMQHTEVSSIGAGDVLIGAFLSLLTQGFSNSICLEIASILASRSVTNYGTSHLVKTSFDLGQTDKMVTSSPFIQTDLVGFRLEKKVNKMRS